MRSRDLIPVVERARRDRTTTLIQPYRKFINEPHLIRGAFIPAGYVGRKCSKFVRIRTVRIQRPGITPITRIAAPQTEHKSRRRSYLFFGNCPTGVL